MFPSCTGKTREFTSSLGWLASLFIYDKKVRLPCQDAEHGPELIDRYLALLHAAQ
jgi:hypothetical protein